MKYLPHHQASRKSEPSQIWHLVNVGHKVADGEEIGAVVHQKA